MYLNYSCHWFSIPACYYVTYWKIIIKLILSSSQDLMPETEDVYQISFAFDHFPNCFQIFLLFFAAFMILLKILKLDISWLFLTLKNNSCLYFAQVLIPFVIQLFILGNEFTLVTFYWNVSLKLWNECISKSIEIIICVLLLECVVPHLFLGVFKIFLSFLIILTLRHRELIVH